MRIAISSNPIVISHNTKKSSAVVPNLPLSEVPDSRFPIPDSRFPIPDSRFPIPDSRFPTEM
ncbi:MAG: hypothetical protein F6K56_34610 [Moorea sp. SIO3G5]|nr:hypothetical protein [Moorena sp. SIO3G5]